MQVLFDQFPKLADRVAAKQQHRWIAQVSAIAVAAKSSYAGLRCPDTQQYGMVVTDIEIINLQATAEPFSIYTGLNIAPTAPGSLLPGVRRRDTGLNPDGSIQPSAVLAWIGQSSTLDGSRIHRVDLVGNDSRWLPLNWYVGRGQDIYCVSENLNRLVACVWRGIAFDTLAAKEAYLARMV